MQVIPVLDLLDGLVVAGIAGERQRYGPIQSRLVESSEPLAVAEAIREQFGWSTLYVADLDAILADRPNWDCYRALATAGFALLVDAGLRDAKRADRVLAAGAHALVAGLETIPTPDLLADLCRRHGAERILFSLDLKQGLPLGDTAAWGTAAPAELAARAIEQGVKQLIVLDLAQVGMQAGVSTLELCRDLRRQHPGVRIITGGGVRSVVDLEALAAAEVDGVLVSSAIHNGRIAPSDIAGRWQS